MALLLTTGISRWAHHARDRLSGERETNRRLLAAFVESLVFQRGTQSRPPRFNFLFGACLRLFPLLAEAVRLEGKALTFRPSQSTTYLSSCPSPFPAHPPSSSSSSSSSSSKNSLARRSRLV